MITGRWGRPAQVLLDIVEHEDGVVTGIANPGRENATIHRGRYDPASRAVHLEGAYTHPDGTHEQFVIAGSLVGRELQLCYRFGDSRGDVRMVRIEDYVPAPLSLRDRLLPHLASMRRWLDGRTRPSGRTNARRLRDRGESLDTIVLRDAAVRDVPALAELHVTTWNATYRTSRGPTIAVRTRQWNDVFAKPSRRDFVLVLENRERRLIGFAWGIPHQGEFAGQLSKIYLRWDYHGLGLGRRMMAESARRFLARGMESIVLFAELSNPTIGFYDRLGGERLLDEHGRFTGAYAWRDLHALARADQPAARS